MSPTEMRRLMQSRLRYEVKVRGVPDAVMVGYLEKAGSRAGTTPEEDTAIFIAAREAIERDHPEIDATTLVKARLGDDEPDADEPVSESSSGDARDASEEPSPHPVQ